MTNKLLDLSRRKFVFGSATGSAGLSLGFGLRHGILTRPPRDGAKTEVDAWVLIAPTIRLRSDRPFRDGSGYSHRISANGSR
ncbi:MAG: hypothetical protein CM1200mP24_08970 [Gammaproteobacteria bacterium]|nr:MAG: hypothetical protein CM1200mP24_08970 [Gammaproteobacteria bacterium]